MKRRVPVTRWKVTLGFGIFLAIITLVKAFWNDPTTDVGSALLYALIAFVGGIIAATLFRHNLTVTREVEVDEEKGGK